MLAAVMAGERADRDRRVGRPERRGAGRGDRAAGQRRHDGEAVDVGGSALVGRHAERGVALEMLDRAEALALGQRDIVGGDVVLEIDERLLLRAATCQSGVTAKVSSSARRRISSGLAVKPALLRRTLAGLGARRRDRRASVIVPFAAPTTVIPLAHGPRHERRDRLVPHRPAAHGGTSGARWDSSRRDTPSASTAIVSSASRGYAP